MEVNSLLCIGRSRLSQFAAAKHSVSMSESGADTAETPTPTPTNEMNEESGLSEKEIISGVSAKFSSRSLSPPTKSILRGKSPSPKHGSPSSHRNVRFSDKESDDDAMYARIHVNKNIQTEHFQTDKQNNETKVPKIDSLNLEFCETHTQLKLSEMHEAKTSTPRYSKLEEIPSLDFHTPRDQDDATSLQQFPRVNHQKHTKETLRSDINVERKHSELSLNSNHTEKTRTWTRHEHKNERIIIDIEIEHKKLREAAKNKGSLAETKSLKHGDNKTSKPKATVKPDGNMIIRNMDLNSSIRSLSPERTGPIELAGCKIIQNMELTSDDHASKFRSAAPHKAYCDASSHRSASPESLNSTTNIPDGSKIIQNMELSSDDSMLKMKSESAQTMDIPDGRKIIQNMERGSLDSSLKSEYVQTIDIPEDNITTHQNMELGSAQIYHKNSSVQIEALDKINKSEPFQSVSIQTDLDSIEESSSKDNPPNNTETRSIAVQATEVLPPKIPDGAQVILNLEIQKVERSKNFTESKQDKRSLNDGNWNEFVKHLELFNPSSSSSSSVSSSGYEPPPSPKAEPVLVYDRTSMSSDTGPTTSGVQQSKTPCGSQRLSERSARTFLESEAFTRQQFESVLKEEGLLSKFESGFKPTLPTSMVTTPAVDRQSVKGPTQPNQFDTMLIRQNKRKQTVFNDNKKDVHRKPLHSIRECVSMYNSTGVGVANYKVQSQQQIDKDTLGFTPIETYSFNPETLTKMASNRACLPVAKATTAQSKCFPARYSAKEYSLASGTKESISKNSFIRGFDLGPAPKSKQSSNVSGNSSILTGDSRTHRSINPVNTYMHSSTGSSSMHSDSRESARANVRSSTISSFSDGKYPVPIYQKSSYSYVTGHASRQSSAQLSTHSYNDFQLRPSSAQISGNKLSSHNSALTSSLKEMRNSALRKHSMNTFSDQKKRTAWGSVPLASKHVSSYRSELDHQRFAQKDTSAYLVSSTGCTSSHANSTNEHSSYSSNIGTTTNLRSYQTKGIAMQSLSPRQVSPDRISYLNALNDQSNARPPSRERSRSRSRSPIPNVTNTYDKSYSELRRSDRLLEYTNKLNDSNSSVNVGVDMGTYVRRDIGFGNFESVVSSGHHAANSVSGNTSSRLATVTPGYGELKKERESRSLTRKPPLPFKVKVPKSKEFEIQISR